MITKNQIKCRGHSFRKPEHLKGIKNIIKQWIDKYLI